MKNKKFIYIGSIIILIILLLMSLTYGAVTYHWWEWNLLTYYTKVDFITIRLPRVLSAVLIGAALSISGILLRRYTHNSLADPGLIGITGGSQLGLTLSMIIFPHLSYLVRFLFAFLGACFVMMILFGLINHTKSTSFILMGVAISAFCTGMVNTLASLFQKNTLLNDWNAGGIQGVSIIQCIILFVFYTVAFLLIKKYQQEIELYVTSPTLAKNVGVNIKKLQWLVGIILCLLVASSVSIAGSLTFFGLLSAVITETIVGQSLKKSINFGLLIGAIIMLLADLISRLWNTPEETSLVAVVAVLCAPVFFLFVYQKGESLK